MPRAKGGPKTRARRKKRLKLAKGQYGAKSRLFRSATESVDKGQQYAYTGRKNRKRDFRQLWIARISAATRAHGLTYGDLARASSRFAGALQSLGVQAGDRVYVGNVDGGMTVHDPSGLARRSAPALGGTPDSTVRA